MEALGTVSARCFAPPAGCGGGAEGVGSRRMALCCKRWRMNSLISDGGVVGVSEFDYFREKGHLDYYNCDYSSPGGRVRGGGRRMITCGCGGGNRTCEAVVKADKKEDKEMKKERKLMKKGLEKMLKARVQGRGDLFPSPEMAGFSFPDPDSLKVSQMISDAAEELVGKLQQLRTDVDLGMEIDSSSSSESSESSDSDIDHECGEGVVTNLDWLNRGIQKNACDTNDFGLEIPSKVKALISPGILVEDGAVKSEIQPFFPAVEAVSLPVLVLEKENADAILQNQAVSLPDTNVMKSSVLVPASAVTEGELFSSTKKIEVCMGGKCKKSGAAAVLGEFQRLLGAGPAVSPCKCMGKCKDGPNVRIVDDPIDKTCTKSLCMGVGLEDVDLIVANYMAEDCGFSLAAAS